MSNLKASPRNGLVEMSAASGLGKRFLDLDSSKVYDADGKFLFAMMKGDDVATEMALADVAANYDAECISANTGRPVTLRDASFRTSDNPMGERVVNCRHMSDGQLRTLASPQGDLAPGDVHIDRGLPGYAAGYALAEGVADLASPPMLVPNQSDKFWTWNERNAFTAVDPIIASAGGSPPEVSAALSNASFQTVPYALGAFVPTELQANADAPLNVMAKVMRVVMDKLKLARERRVVTTLQTTGSWNSNLVNTVAAGNKWNGGAGADPVLDLTIVCEQSFMDPTDIVMSQLVYNRLCQSPAIQKYFYAKDGSPQIPSHAQFATMFPELPKITVAKMKYLPTAAGAITYAWGNHVVLLRSTAALATQQDIAPTRTFRWVGGPTSDGGSAVGGWTVRTYFDPKRGPRGGTAIVVTHNDDDSILTSKNVGGVVYNAYQ